MANLPVGWEPCTSKPQPRIDEHGAFDLREGANDLQAYYNCFEQQLDELASYKNLKGPNLEPTQEECTAAIREWDLMLQQLAANLRPVLKSKGLRLLGIDRGDSGCFDSRAYIKASAGRRFDVDLKVDEIEARTNGRETFQVLEEMVVHGVLAQREAFHERVKRLGREIENNVVPIGGKRA